MNSKATFVPTGPRSSAESSPMVFSSASTPSTLLRTKPAAMPAFAAGRVRESPPHHELLRRLVPANVQPDAHNLSRLGGGLRLLQFGLNEPIEDTAGYQKNDEQRGTDANYQGRAPLLGRGIMGFNLVHIGGIYTAGQA